MTDFLKGNTPATIYKQLLGLGGAADHVGLTSSLKSVFTDDGAGSSNSSSIKLSTTALRVEAANQLRFRDDAIYIASSGDSILNIVADGEIDLATAAVDINATTSLAIDNTNTSNGVTINTVTSGSPISIGHSTSETTVNDNLTVTGTTAHTGVVTMATGVKLQFVDGNEYLSGNSSILTLGSSSTIHLAATTDVTIPNDIGLIFGDAGEKIEGNGTKLDIMSSGALELTGAANSIWKTTAGSINIDAEASTVEIDGHSGVTIQGNAATVLLESSGAVDINSGVFTLDGAALSLDGTDDSNITVTGLNKDLDLQVVGGGTTQTLAITSAGTGTTAININASAGGIDMSSGGGGDIDIHNSAKSVNITADENAEDAVTILASQGGIDISAIGSSGEDIDITATGSSVNLTSTENSANAIYLRANGGTSETIKIHSDQGTGDDSIYVLSDVGGISIESGKTGAITNMASDSASSITNAVIRIGTDTANCDIAIGNGTSDVLIGDNLKVAGDLHIAGAINYTDFTVTKASATLAVYDNQNHTNADGGRDSTLKFTGQDASGAADLNMVHIVASHDGSSADQKGKLEFKTNAGAEGTSPSAALTLSADNTATFTGAIAAGTNVITGGQVNADNLRLDGNVLSSTDSNGNITLTANGTGGIMMLNTNASGIYSTSIGNGANADGAYAFASGRAARASGTDSVSIGDTNTASSSNSVAIGNTNTSSAQDSIAIGSNNVASESYAIALGFRSKADRKRELSFASGYASAVGDTRVSRFHDYDRHAISSSWQNIDSLQGGITLPSDGVAMGTTLIVGSTTGAALTIGFKIDWLAENDGGTYAIVQQSLTSLDTEDTSIDAQMAISSDKIVAQVTDAAITSTFQWSVSTTLVQHNW